MELRWMYYPNHFNSGLPTGRVGVIYAGSEGQQYAMVLEYREGCTHDSPWLPVPLAFYQPEPVRVPATESK